MTEAPEVPALFCSEPACRISEGGTCLDGFPEPGVCPQATFGEAATVDGLDHDDLDEMMPDGTESELPESTFERSELVGVPGDEALTLDEVGDLMARRSVSVVLLAGEAEVGKTTLVSELFARFLLGQFGPWLFGGSETLRAFHIRLHPSLAESGAGTSTTERTADEEMRFLHLDLARGQERHNIIVSDGKGEYFKNLIDGNRVNEEIPVAARVDRCLIAVDGVKLNNARQRDSAISHARLLLRALRGPGGISPDCPVALICTKWDRVDRGSRGAVLERLEALAAGQEGHVVVLRSSVRPGPPAAEIDGLLDLLEFIAPPSPVARGRETNELGGLSLPPSGRHFWRGPAVIGEDPND